MNDIKEYIDNDGLYRFRMEVYAGKAEPPKKELEKFYYLCTPYSKYPGGLEEAYQLAAEMTMFLEKHGLFIYCPIVHSHTPSKYATPELKNSYDFWLTIDKKFVRLSKGLIVCMMTGWQQSFGINEELKWADEMSLPVYYTRFKELPDFTHTSTNGTID